ncbi:MAG: phage head closure protein [Armatimonadota bacterium]
MNLNSTATIKRITTATSSIGEMQETEAVFASGVACMLETITGDERIILGAKGVDCTHLMITRYTQITEKDRVVIGTRTFNVTLVDNVHELGRHMEITLKELKDVS